MDSKTIELIKKNSEILRRDNADTYTKTNTVVLKTTADTFRLHFCGDWHIGAKDFDYNKFNEYCYILENDNDSAIIMMGDLLDTFIDGAVGEHFGEMSTPQAEELLIARTSRFSNRIIGFVDGNHEERCNRKGLDTPLKYIMTESGVKNARDKYSPNSMYLALIIENTVKHTHVQYNIVFRHNMVTIAPKSMNADAMVRNKLNTYVRDHCTNADIICCAHSHIPVACATERTFPSWNEVWLDESIHHFKDRHQYIGMTGSLLKFVGSYADKKDYVPRSRKQICFMLSSVDKKVTPCSFDLPEPESDKFPLENYKPVFGDDVYVGELKKQKENEGSTLFE